MLTAKKITHVSSVPLISENVKFTLRSFGKAHVREKVGWSKWRAACMHTQHHHPPVLLPIDCLLIQQACRSETNSYSIYQTRLHIQQYYCCYNSCESTRVEIAGIFPRWKRARVPSLGEGEKSLLGDPGPELRLGREEGERKSARMIIIEGMGKNKPKQKNMGRVSVGQL